MQTCLPGFVASVPRLEPSDIVTSSSERAHVANTTCKCIGGPEQLSTFRGNLICDKDDLISEIRNGYWIGVVPAYNNTKLYMGSSALLHRYSKKEKFRLAQRYILNLTTFNV